MTAKGRREQGRERKKARQSKNKRKRKKDRNPIKVGRMTSRTLPDISSLV